ncbi:MAG: YHS domain-containing protein [Steroidobacteraceae bacterium]
MSWGTILYFLLWASAFAVMMRLGCGAHVLGHGRGHGDSSGDGGNVSGSGSASKVSEQSTDPVCGMSVPTATAKTAVHAGQVYYFCSLSCREKFETTPATYQLPRIGEGSATQPGEHRHGNCC